MALKTNGGSKLFSVSDFTVRIIPRSRCDSALLTGTTHNLGLHLLRQINNKVVPSVSVISYVTGASYWSEWYKNVTYNITGM